MKTTVKVPDKLYRRAKAEAALRGCTLEELIEEGLRLVLRPLPRTRRLPSLAQLTKGACGVVDSGVSDLASNSQHLADFGRHARRHR